MSYLLCNTEMSIAEKLAVNMGISNEVMMEAAGWQVAVAIRKRFKPRLVHVLCGPGNNGGDGFVVARLLTSWGWAVRLFLLVQVDQLRNDVIIMAERWCGSILPLTIESLNGNPLIVDALFGSGLTRPLDGLVRGIIEEINVRHLDVVSIDIPSGVNGNDGQVLGVSARACLTVTFFRPKPGHFLLPGRLFCGELVIANIGIPEIVLDTIAPKIFMNTPFLWYNKIKWPKPEDHKYNRGHLLVSGGAILTGAAWLVAMAARRVGAGLVTLVVPEEKTDVYRSNHSGIMVQSISSWRQLILDRRVKATVIGPGLGVGCVTKNLVIDALSADKQCVIDADALTSFSDDPQVLWNLGKIPVLTPHDGEFVRLFSYQGDRLTRASSAAASSGAVILLKGSDTVVASPDGRAAILVEALPVLASGGTGDVLSGLIGGLLAQGMSPFDASCFGSWLHARASQIVGLGLIAEDLINVIPTILQNLTDENISLFSQ
ncbi:MAG: NAD(P)H-hydrate dehydratase [Rhodospirillaceae bacterium]|nr:NAD(P)H-hydrate dehydratase [Rhodospirillaceae bacterium]